MRSKSMTESTHFCLQFVCCLCFLFAPLVTQADDFDELYKKGASYYAKKMFSEASRAFREVYKLKPDCQLHFNIGQCEFSLENFDLALESFKLYVKTCSDQIDPERREYVDEVIETIEPRVGYVEIKESNTFEIWVDDIHRSATPLSAPLYVMEGQHELVLKKGDYTIFKKPLTVKNGETVVVEVPKEETAAVLAASKPKPASNSDPTSKKSAKAPQEKLIPYQQSSSAESRKPPLLKPLGISLAGVGGAIAVSSIITGAIHLSKKNDFEDKCPDGSGCLEENESLYDKVNALAIATNVLASVGATFVVAGVILAVVGHKKESTKHGSGNIISAAPLIDRDTAGFSFSGRF